MNTSINRGGNRPAQSPHAVMDCVDVCAEVDRQILGRACHAFVGVQDDAPLIDALRFRSRPSAIARLVAAVVVDSVNRVLRGWQWTHCGVERFKGLQPFLAHRNPTCAIADEVFPRRASATVDHVGPASILRRVRHAVCGLRLQQFSLNASTGMGASEVASGDEDFGAAIAAAAIRGMTWVRGGAVVVQNGQSAIARAARQLGLNHPPILPYFTYELA